MSDTPQTSKPNAQKKERKLTMIERECIERYATPGSPTFGNGKQSYKIASPNNVTDSSAESQASRLLKQPQAISYIEDIFDNYHYSIEDRSRHIGRVGHPDYRYETVTYDKDGEVITRVEKQITPQQVAHVVDIANRMSGIYNMSKIAAREAERDIQEQRAQLKAKLKIKDVS